MKQTLTTSQVADLLHSDSNANWSYAGARALAEWLEEMEESTGEETELDVVAIRCDFAEWKSLEEWAADYFSGDWRESIPCDEGGEEEAIRDYIDGNGHLIEFDGGVIVSGF
jgi:hypothetical protein